MPNNRARGRRGELQAAERYAGKRISVTGLPGSDVEIAGRPWEVKLTKAMPALLRNWLTQAARQGSEGVLFKENLGKWYVIIEADKFFHEYIDLATVHDVLHPGRPHVESALPSPEV